MHATVTVCGLFICFAWFCYCELVYLWHFLEFLLANVISNSLAQENVFSSLVVQHNYDEYSVCGIPTHDSLVINLLIMHLGSNVETMS